MKELILVNKCILFCLATVYTGQGVYSLQFHPAAATAYRFGMRAKVLHILGHWRHTAHMCFSKPWQRVLPRVSQGSFFQEHMSRPVSKMAWSWRVPSFPINPDCHWQKLLKVWSAWWLITSPGYAGDRPGARDNRKKTCCHAVVTGSVITEN